MCLKCRPAVQLAADRKERTGRPDASWIFETEGTRWLDFVKFSTRWHKRNYRFTWVKWQGRWYLENHRGELFLPRDAW